jgi:hypothetical protein
MSTPGAIAVYTSGTGVPENVRTRPWRGVYHHWDGYPEGLGQNLIHRVHSMRGDLHAVARLLIDEAPWGWSTCIDSDERYSKDDPGLPVSPADTGNVAYVYVLDVEARRLDAFATHADADGERIGSIHFSPTGEPDLPALNLLPIELIQEPALPGPELTADSLRDILQGLEGCGTDSAELQWVNASETDDGGLTVVFRVIHSEDGSIVQVAEQEWALVPRPARHEPERVRHCLEALVGVVSEEPQLLDAFWIAFRDPLRRSGARQRETFKALFRAYADP